MAKKQTKEDSIIEKNLTYLGLNLDKIPTSVLDCEPVDFTISKSYEENKYKQYRYVPIKDIQILLSPTNRLDDLQERYKKASPLASYLVPDIEENILKHTVFLNIIKNMNIDKIKQIDEEQKELNKRIPFKVKYPGNYLWQIYYSENMEKYFMLVPTEDSDYSAFLYLLMKQLKSRVVGKIFVPISHIEYTRRYLNKTEFEDIENYLWLFTKDWPLVYEVFDKSDNLTIQIIGETEIYNNIKSSYKIQLSSEEEASKFYKLIKALYILQTELPHYFKFETRIDKDGEIQFYKEDVKLEYDSLASFIKEEYINLEQKQESIEKDTEKYNKKIDELKKESKSLEADYLDKEKQISTYLECKKTFFGKVKYFFKYNKKTKGKHQKQDINEEEKQETKQEKQEKKGKQQKEYYTLEELIEEYKKYEIKELYVKNTAMDVNAIKLKNKNLSKKIENASLYIKEIDSHKKSIFEFWKYTNKDEVSALAEGEEEKVNTEKRMPKIFDYEIDLEDFGIKYDKKYRKDLSEDELDSVYIATTNIIDILNKVKNNEINPKEIEANLKELKEEKLKYNNLAENEDIDIFGGIIEDSRKIKKIADKSHREVPKDKFNILDINKTTKQLGYKLSLERVVENIKNVLDKETVEEDICIYKLLPKEEENINDFCLFDINPEEEINNVLKMEVNTNKFILYKINLLKESKAMVLTNIIYYNNKNKTLPVGMNIDTKILVDLSKYNLKMKNNKTLKKVCFKDESDDLSKYDIKDIKVIEYDVE